MFYHEPSREIPTDTYDVIIAGGGTAGVFAAIAAARCGARTALIESKGYVGGIAVEGGTALHSFYNLWKAFPGVPKRQVVRGIGQELVDRLSKIGGCSGHADMSVGFDYDSVCTAIDTEAYKLVALEMLQEANVKLFLNTLLVDAVTKERRVQAAIIESRSGREALYAHTFIDCTGYGDLCARSGAAYEEPNDHPVANSMGVGGVNLEKYHAFFNEHGALTEEARGLRSGRANEIVRISGNLYKVERDFAREADRIGMSTVTTSVHDDYFMFIKLNYKMEQSPTDRDAVSAAEIELRRRQFAALRLFQKYVPGCENAFIARSSPSLSIRRGRCIECDYDLSLEDILTGRHHADDIMAYGFHDCAPRLQIQDGATYGIPLRALCVRGLDNLLTAGMTITSDWEAHMSTRNTVCCMGQGQAAGTAAALCAAANLSLRDLPYPKLRQTLLQNEVYLENSDS